MRMHAARVNANSGRRVASMSVPPAHPLFSGSRTALHSLARWASAMASFLRLAALGRMSHTTAARKRSVNARALIVAHQLARDPARRMTSAAAQKAAYMRRHNLGPKSPREDDWDVPTPRSKAKSEEKTFAEKRKENLLSRARGGKVPEIEVAVTAVLFAAKLKRISSAAAEEKKEKKEKVPMFPPRTHRRPASQLSSAITPTCRRLAG